MLTTTNGWVWWMWWNPGFLEIYVGDCVNHHNFGKFIFFKPKRRFKRVFQRKVLEISHLHRKERVHEGFHIYYIFFIYFIIYITIYILYTLYYIYIYYILLYIIYFIYFIYNIYNIDIFIYLGDWYCSIARIALFPFSLSCLTPLSGALWLQLQVFVNAIRLWKILEV